MNQEYLSRLSEDEVAILAARMFMSKRGYDAEVGVSALGKSSFRYILDLYVEKQKWFGAWLDYAQVVEIETSQVDERLLERHLIKFNDLSARAKYDKLVVIAMTGFTEDAKEYADSHNIDLVDRTWLSEQLASVGLLQ